MRTPIKLITSVMALTMFVAPHARAATLAPVAVFSDSLADNPSGEDVTPVGGASDLVAGYVGETDDAVQVVWQVADLVDALAAPAPQFPVFYMWEMKLTEPNGKSSYFQARARLYPSEPTPINANDPTGAQNPPDVPPYWPWGQLQGNCIAGTAVITCAPIAHIDVTFDPIANTVTASIKRDLLKSSDGTPLAVDGAVMEGAVIFQGFAACIPVGLLLEAPLCDTAVMDDVYTLGTPRE